MSAYQAQFSPSASSSSRSRVPTSSRAEWMPRSIQGRSFAGESVAVARHAVIASSFGLRFQGEGYFLTDARTHRGTSGAPVVMRAAAGDWSAKDLPWRLLGIHSARLDVGTRDLELDEALGLNCAWYADILLTLTEG